MPKKSNEKIKKLKRRNILLVFLAIFVILTAAFCVFMFLCEVFGGPIFKGPFDTYSARWYSKNPKIELIMEDENSNNFNEFNEHPINITINGQEETYYLRIFEPKRSFYISKGGNSTKILKGTCTFRLNKFIMEIKECSDERFAEYDKIILKRDLWYKK